MFKSVALVAAFAFTALAAVPANAGAYSSGVAGLKQSTMPAVGQEQLVHKTGKKGKFVAGLMVGLGTAAILSHGAYGYYDGYSHRRQCRRLKHRCWNGNWRACQKFEYRC